MTINFKRLNPDAVLPAYAKDGDSGMDLCAVEDVVLLAGVPTLVRTGWAVELPEPRRYRGGFLPQFDESMEITFEAQVRPRSGLALKHGIQVVNAPGTVDNGYRGEIGVILMWDWHRPNVWAWNRQGDIGRVGYKHHTEFTEGEVYALGVNNPTAYRICKGERIAQLVIAPVIRCQPDEVAEISESTCGARGFGSTGL